MNISQTVGNVSLNPTTPAVLPTSSYPYLSTGQVWAAAVPTAIFGVAGLFENLAVLLFLLTEETLLTAPANVFLLSLAAAEFLLCGFVAPLTLVSLVDEQFYDYALNIGRFFGLSTTLSIVLVLLNRLVGTVYSLKYHAVMTLYRAKVLVAIVWAVGATLLILVAMSYITGIIFLRRLIRYLVLISVIVTISINVYLYMNARKHQRAIETQFRSVHPQQFMKTDSRAIRSILLVTGTFVVGWLPITIAVMTTDRYSVPDDYFEAYFMTAPMVFFNAALDPYIYFFRSEQFKNSYARLKRRHFPMTPQPPDPPSNSAFVVPIEAETPV